MAACLASLAFWILLSGLDDLFVALAWLTPRRKRFPWPAERDLDRAPERRIAILLPLWNEHRVIGQMLERNLASIRYTRYDIFAGVYPNDEPTARAVDEVACRDPRVHLAMLPHAGPTSKGDCLNWIWHRMQEYEVRHGLRFEIVVTHDAEDLVHAESLRLVNWFSREYQMVQIPVLALATGWAEFTHGIYCDEFAEYQQKDIPVRQRLGGFLPSNGVGTGFEREALERLAAARQGKVFDSECLTEDYENGFCLHQLGCRQLFVPLLPGAAPVATREYFPRRFRAAVRQRSRWVAGIALQGWQRHGWRPRRQIYWLWRDRKGLIGNLLSPLTNVLFCYGLAHWRAAMPVPHWLAPFCAAALGVSVFQMSVRAACSARIYGWRFAASTPLRMWWGNLVNLLATVAAIRQFAADRLGGRRLTWRKTEHVYPAHAPASTGQPRLGEILVRMQWLSMKELEEALRKQPKGMRLGEYLLQAKQLSEENLYHALSLHAGVELGVPAELNHKVTRTLPLATIRRWKIMPYRIDLGQLYLLTPEVPTEQMTRELAHCCSLAPRFRLVRQSEFERLMAQCYGG
jgi:adsorption protein B